MSAYGWSTSFVAAPSVLNSLAGGTLTWDVYFLIEAITGSLLLYASPRIQAVFVATTATMFIRIGGSPKWLGYLGIAFAIPMFIVPIVWTPIGLGLPVYASITSITVLLARNLAGPASS